MNTECLNCGEKLEGNFCHACGQEAGDKNIPLSVWISEIFDSITDLDSRSVRTLSKVLLQPGVPARDYVAGQRSSHVAPAKLFFAVSAFVIPLMVVSGWFEKVVPDENLGEMYSVVFPLLNLLSPFIGAIVLKVLFFRQMLYEHLVFSLYWGTGIIVWGIPLVFVPTHWISLVYNIALLLIYGYLSIAVFYGGGLVRRIGFTLAFVVLWMGAWQLLTGLVVDLIKLNAL